jgi:hypothetical protein
VKKHIIILVISLALPSAAHAHPGGLDSYGCHNDRKRGGYHCHKGEFAGESFSSQSEMLKAKRKSVQADDGAGKAKNKAKKK